MTSTSSARAAGLAATAVLAAGVLAACGNGLSTASGASDHPIVNGPSASTTSPGTSSPSSSTSTRTRPTPTRPRPAKHHPTPVPVVTSGAASGGTSTGTSTGTTQAASTTCGPGSLVVGLRTPRGGGTAGSQYELLTFRNVSATTCTVDGHPGVSFVGHGNGTQLGVPAARTGAVHAVRLTPGTSATALLQVVDAGNYDPAACAPTTSDGLRVYPPDWRVSVFVPFRTQACQRDPGTSPQLTVSAVG